MARKVRELVRDLRAAGFEQLPSGGKGSHRKFVHERLTRFVTLSGHDGDEAKPYQEKQVKQAIDEVQS